MTAPMCSVKVASAGVTGECPGSVWAMICGVAPIPVMSGKIDNRYRLNGGGNRQANNAIWRIVITRLGQHDPRTMAYMTRRLAEGKSKPEIIRCLKRYVARETFQAWPQSVFWQRRISVQIVTGS